VVGKGNREEGSDVGDILRKNLLDCTQRMKGKFKR
jgi:hypothetical protein